MTTPARNHFLRVSAALAAADEDARPLSHATGYELDDVHRADVAALATAFGLAVPDGSLDSRASS